MEEFTDVITERTKASFNETTIRLVAEFVTRTGQNPTMVNLPSFMDLFRHLNPIADIPTVPDIENSAEVRPYFCPSACIVCGMNGQEERTFSLTVNDAAIVLTTTILGADREKVEAMRKILSSSLRCCTWHFENLYKMIYEKLEIGESKDLSEVSPNRLEEWADVFKEIKTLRDEIEDPSLNTARFQKIFQDFLDAYNFCSVKRENVEEIPPFFEEKPEHLMDFSTNVPQSSQVFEESPENSEVPMEEPQCSSERNAGIPPKPEIITLPNGKKVIRLPHGIPKKIGESGKFVTYQMTKRKSEIPEETDKLMEKVPKMEEKPEKFDDN